MIWPTPSQPEPGGSETRPPTLVSHLSNGAGGGWLTGCRRCSRQGKGMCALTLLWTGPGALQAVTSVDIYLPSPRRVSIWVRSLQATIVLAETSRREWLCLCVLWPGQLFYNLSWLQPQADVCAARIVLFLGSEAVCVSHSYVGPPAAQGVSLPRQPARGKGTPEHAPLQSRQREQGCCNC